MYTYGSFMLRFDRKQQNSVKAITLQFKKKKKTKLMAKKPDGNDVFYPH